MTHVDIDYTNRADKTAAALKDVEEWLGSKRFKDLSQHLKEYTDSRQFAFVCSFAGFSGFPVIAFYEHIHGKDSWIDPPDVEITDATSEAPTESRQSEAS